MTLAEDRTIKQYLDQGFRRVVVRRDEPHFSYPLHYHSYDLAFQILEGEMTVIMNHQPTELHPGDRATIPASVFHAVHIGSQGCVYIHAEKSSVIS